VSADGTQIILPKPLSSSSTAKTASLDTILATLPAVGTVARATDVQGSALESTGTKWVGCLGVGLSAAQIAAIVTTNLGDGAWVIPQSAGLRIWDSGAGIWLEIIASTPITH
jgi:small ligand-binding sensory domain FIST